jgi:hypothetical protein
MTLKSKYIGLMHVYIEIPLVVVGFVRLMSLSKISLPEYNNSLAACVA